MQRIEGSLCGRNYRLATTLAPHIAAAVLGESRRNVVVVGGRNLDNPAQVLPHLGGRARVSLVAGAQLAIGVGAPRIESTLISDSKSVCIAAHLWIELY